jgi:hypothetical protein
VAVAVGRVAEQEKVGSSSGDKKKLRSRVGSINGKRSFGILNSGQNGGRVMREDTRRLQSSFGVFWK